MDNNEKEEISRITEEVNKEEARRKQEELEAKRIEEIKKEESKQKSKEENSLQNKYLLLVGILIALFACIIILFKVLNKEEEKPSTDAPIEERIAYVLKNRYGKDFTYVKDGTYKDEKNLTFYVRTNDNTSSKLIVFDEYLNELQVNKISSKISNILTSSGLSNVSVKLAPQKDCRFVGACVSNDNYYNNYKDNTDEDLLSKRSDSIVLKEYLNMNNTDFFNKYGFMIYIKITGDYNNQNKNEIKNIIEDLFDQLNESGYENNMGYEINVKDKEGIADVMNLVGSKTDNKRFNLLEAKEN